MEIPFTHHTLPNGLDVIVHEDHGTPIVAVNIWYRVGSKNEQPGLTGLAHLFEHLMFEGSAHHDDKYFAPLQEAGGQINGSTTADRTNYWEVVPTGALELALWLESDRMGFLLPAVTEDKFKTQREVVLNERRQVYENRPYGMASIALSQALYPPTHPYHWPTIGVPADLYAATLAEVHDFFRRYYHPGNASLAIAGDVDTDEVLRLAEQYFGDLPGRDLVDQRHPPIPATPEARVLLEDRVELPRLYLAWQSPGFFAPGDAELDLLAEILGGGKISRLYRGLVYERRIAVDVVAVQSSRQLAGTFQVVATAAPGCDLAELEAHIREEIARCAREEPAVDELERARTQVEAEFTYRLQTVGGFGGKSDQLNAYNTYCNNPGYFGEDLARYQRASGGALRAAATRWLDVPGVALSVVPVGERARALPESAVAEVS
ncbi:MAG: insulinase family protein [Luteitalea sp.]|nr:insulinase family protein [Luteitalea sp.]